MVIFSTAKALNSGITFLFVSDSLPLSVYNNNPVKHMQQIAIVEDLNGCTFSVCVQNSDTKTAY